MNIAEWIIRKKTFVLFVVTCLGLAGIFSYFQLGRLEDPTFTIKTAVVVTRYPGAMPDEVERTVTNEIEMAAQKMGQVDTVRSLSKQGLSIVYVDVKDRFVADELPAIWNELRNKVRDVQTKLPPGARTSLVNDDYGDVYGVYFALTGRGYSMADLKDYADYLKKEFLLVDDVARVEIQANLPEVVYVDTSPAKMASLGISPDTIFSLLNAENALSPLARTDSGTKRLVIDPTGGFASVEKIGDLLVGTPGGSQIHLRDIAKVTRGTLDPPTALMRFNGRPALGIGISTVDGGNVIRMGEGIREKLKELESSTPAGMELHTVYYQATQVNAAINDFLINLVEAVAIIVGLLLFFMGISSGLLIGGVLLLIMAGTFVGMKMLHIDMQSVSMASLIIALGLLVDDAIVVTDGILVRIRQGMDRTKAAAETVKETMWPLLGATLISILAFAAIGLSQDSTGEYCRSLFQIMAISLMLSWVLAISVTPLLCVMILERNPGRKKSEREDPYDTRFYRFYRKLLQGAISHRRLTLGVMGGLLALSLVGFTLISQSFFPVATIPYFSVEYDAAAGTSIEETSKGVAAVETFLKKQEGVSNVTSFAGEGALRFLLTYDPVAPDPSYGQLLVEVDDTDRIEPLMETTRCFLLQHFPGARPRVARFSKGPSTDAKVQARFSGPDPAVLRTLAKKAEAAMRKRGAVHIRNDWHQHVLVLKPEIIESRARRAGLTRPDINRALQNTYSGATVGVYREGRRLLPVISRIPGGADSAPGKIPSTMVWSSAAHTAVPLDSVLTSVQTVFRNPVIHRRNRLRTVTAECDPIIGGNANALFASLKPAIEAIERPDGYSLEWGGTHEKSANAQNGLMRMLPLSLLLMVVIVVALFNSLRKSLIICLCVPLATIGVTLGLIATGVSFSFMALLGFLSLSGMLLKDAIVLVSQIDLELEAGRAPHEAVIESAVSRLRPVMMTTLSTVFGVIPLLTDILFSPLAVTIMFGLTFASLLTLLVVPTLYVTFFRVPVKTEEQT